MDQQPIQPFVQIRTGSAEWHTIKNSNPRTCDACGALLTCGNEGMYCNNSTPKHDAYMIAHTGSTRKASPSLRLRR